MATNPMQRKSRISFLLGMLVMLVIAAIIIALLYMKINSQQEEIKKYVQTTTKVYTLKQDVKSGQVLTSNMFDLTDVPISTVPSGATTNIKTTLSSYSLTDTTGRTIYYHPVGVDFTAGESATTANTTNTSGNSGASNLADSTTDFKNQAFYYLSRTVETGTTKTVYKYPLYVTSTDGKESLADSLKSKDKAHFYQNGTSTQATEITIAENAVVAKVDMNTNSVITTSLISRADEIISNDTRKQEYNVVSLPVDLQPNEYVDIRFMLPNGQDYIVVSKKKVTIPVSNGAYLADTIQMNLSEEETLLMSSAIVESFEMKGSKLYATRYTEAGLQEAASETYTPNSYVITAIKNDKNIVDSAIKQLNSRKNDIDTAMSQFGTEENIQTKADASATTTLEQRRNYLQTLVPTTVPATVPTV